MQYMKKGQKAVITIPPELGYGAKGIKGLIPPNQPIYFDIEILDWWLGKSHS